MDCCGEYRAVAAHAQAAHAHAPYGPHAPHAPAASARWDYAYAPLPYAPYTHYYPHDPYRYYRYDYPHHTHHTEHGMPMDYGAYASKEARVRRSMARRDARALAPSHHLPLPPTPPLECSVNGRSPYCESQMWSPYQMGVGGGWNGANAAGNTWIARNSCAREHMRYAPDFRPLKGHHVHSQNQVCPPEGRSTPFPGYEESLYGGEGSARHGNTPEYSSGARAETPRASRERERVPNPVEPRRSPPEEKRPPVVPLPAFQQAFGSTEIGKFAEAFSREVAINGDASSENFSFDSYTDWDAPSDSQWPTPREIKCEDNF